MTRYAIISDIHGNVHALTEVLTSIATLDVDGIVCLGDVVGYGANPGACVDLVVGYCHSTIKGNHEHAALDPRRADQMNEIARNAILWTRNELTPLHLDALNRLPDIVHLNDRVMCIHDCPVPATTSYIHDKFMAAIAFRGVQSQICLVGHTHVPMVFEAPGLNVEDQYNATEITAYVGSDGTEIPLHPGCRYVCNPGAVGQPRDADPRASFGVLDLARNTFTVHRREYDVAAAQADAADAGLPPVLSQRLAIGA